MTKAGMPVGKIDTLGDPPAKVTGKVQVWLPERKPSTEEPTTDRRIFQR